MHLWGEKGSDAAGEDGRFIIHSSNNIYHVQLFLPSLWTLVEHVSQSYIFQRRHVWLMSTLRGSAQVQQLYVMNATTALLIFFFSVFIGGWHSNFKGACRQLKMFGFVLSVIIVLSAANR